MITQSLKQKLMGIIIPNIFSIVTIWVTKYLLTSNGEPIFIFSEFVIVPLLMGIMAAWFWKDLNLKSGTVTTYSIYSSILAILLSFIFLGEGLICLVIVSPLIVCLILTGVFIGRSMFKRNDKTLNVSFISLLIFVFLWDSFSNHEYKNMVSDTIIINAPPSKVWKNVVSFKKIKQKNTFWLFQIGMPSPIESTVEGNYVGAGRKCIFSNGYVFGERIATYEPLNDLTFDIINQPRDPEIMNHIDILRGQFLLKDNGNGTTTLTGNSWYRLYVFPVWYYDIWAQSITRNVHLRVMQHIKELSEN